MIRKPETLLPSFRAKVEAWVAACAARDVELLVYCTYRSPEEQKALYAQGRTRPGPIVTNAKPWKSAHQYRRAVDAIPIVNGKPDWSYADLNRDQVPDEPWWAVMVEEAEALGIEWAGRWKSFKEFVHWQDLSPYKTVAELYQYEGPNGNSNKTV